jgi:tetratricopeptide (TPR) repeat protein
VAALGGAYRLLSASGAGSPSALDALARACAEAANTAGEAACHLCRGLVALARSEHDTARACYEEALPLYRRVGSVLGEAGCIYSLGDIALRCSEHDTARARYEEALPLYRRVGDVLGEANCIQNLGHIALRRSHHDTARAC